MAFEVFPQIIIMFSTAIIIFIIARNMPRVENEQKQKLQLEIRKEKEIKKKLFNLYNILRKKTLEVINKDEFDKKTNLLYIRIEKILRRIRIRFLRLDNKVASLLEKLRKKHTKFIENTAKKTEKNNKVNKKNLKHKSKKIQTKKEDTTMKAIDVILENYEKNKKTYSKEKIKCNRIINKIKNKGNKKQRKSKEKEYLEKIAKDPKNIELYWKLGILYSRKRSYEDAVSCFRQIDRLDPNHPKAKKKVLDLEKKIAENK